MSPILQVFVLVKIIGKFCVNIQVRIHAISTKKDFVYNKHFLIHCKCQKKKRTPKNSELVFMF